MKGRFRDANRDATMVALYTGGATMDEIAEISGGISRQRVQQIIARNDVKGYNCERIDPIRVVAICRRPDVRRWHHVATQLGGGATGHTLRAMVASFGMVPAIERLFNWRQRAYRDRRASERRVELTASYRALAQRLGRVPTQHELRPENGVSFWPIFMKHFAGIAELRRAAGLNDADQRTGARRTTRMACKRGHLYAETRDKWGRCRECIKLRKQGEVSA